LAALILTAKGVPFIYYAGRNGMHNIRAESYCRNGRYSRKPIPIGIDKGKPDEALVAEINTIAINPVVQCNGIVKHLLDPKILDKDKL
jgi:hypothetical protein